MSPLHVYCWIRSNLKHYTWQHNATSSQGTANNNRNDNIGEDAMKFFLKGSGNTNKYDPKKQVVEKGNNMQKNVEKIDLIAWHQPKWLPDPYFIGKKTSKIRPATTSGKLQTTAPSSHSLYKYRKRPPTAGVLPKNSTYLRNTHVDYNSNNDTKSISIISPKLRMNKNNKNFSNKPNHRNKKAHSIVKNSNKNINKKFMRKLNVFSNKVLTMERKQRNIRKNNYGGKIVVNDASNPGGPTPFSLVVKTLL
eukprot:g2321.t1